MSVYVDDMGAPYRGMLMCHMIADSSEELLCMADRIGVKRRWLQHGGTAKEHFDICLAKRKLAIEAGAIAVSMRELRARQLRKDGQNGPQGSLFAAVKE